MTSQHPPVINGLTVSADGQYVRLDDPLRPTWPCDALVQPWDDGLRIKFGDRHEFAKISAVDLKGFGFRYVAGTGWCGIVLKSQREAFNQWVADNGLWVARSLQESIFGKPGQVYVSGSIGWMDGARS